MENNTIRFGAIHNHTTYSFNDAVADPEALVKRAAELGCPALEISDHGSCAGWIKFYKACLSSNIEPILGVEAYVMENAPESAEEDSEDEVTAAAALKPVRQHLNVMAKNYEGYQMVSEMVTGSYKNMDTRHFPITTKANLMSHFGPGTQGHGNVVATSACISGVIADKLLYNYRIGEKIAKLEAKQAALGITSSPEDTIRAYEEYQAQIARDKETLKELKALAATKTAAREKKVERMPEGPEKEEARKALAADRESYAKAAADAKELGEAVIFLQSEMKALKPDYDRARKALAAVQKYEGQIGELKSLMKPQEQMEAEAREEIRWYQECFGEGNFFIELQYHGFENEEYVYTTELRLAKEMKVPYVAANDTHMVSRLDVMKRELIANARYISSSAPKWKEFGDAESELYLKSDDELVAALEKIIGRKDALIALSNVGKIAAMCKGFRLPDTKHYPEWPDADEYLLGLIEKGKRARYGEDIPEEIEKRIEYEYSVIKNMGYSAYFCLVADFIEKAKASDVNSIEIGPGRGSAAGSVVAYVTGITERIDPLQYDLMFERFLNPSRVSMPDIDTDFSAHARDFAISYVKEKYGNVTGIMTVGTMKARKALDYASKLHAISKGLDKGTFADRAAAMKAMLADAQSELSSIVGEVAKKFSDDIDALEIFKKAELMEGIPSNFGRHAAGIIIGDSTPLSSIAPIMMVPASDGTIEPAIQADMGEVEGDLHLLKMDFLGLTNLDVITMTMRMVTEKYGTVIDPYSIPFEEEVFEGIYANGNTNFVFQFESDGMKKMLRNFTAADKKGIRFEDLVMLVAAYRPGPMQYLDGIIEVKTGKREAAYDIPELEPILKDTYGAVIYQEQVIRICQQLAGYSLAQADNVRKFMSKKKMDKLVHEKESFVSGDPERGIPGCVANGIDRAKAEKLFDELIEFGNYAFNKSHAALYAFVSYITAYLKFHYRKEYLSAAISTYGEKLPQFSSDCETFGIKVYGPDVNESGEYFKPYKDGIIYGLRSIVGVSAPAAKIVEEREANGRFASLEDFVTRCMPDKTTAEGLAYSGALKAFTANRTQLAEYLQKYRDLVKKHAGLVAKRDEAAKALAGIEGEGAQAKAFAAMENLLGEIKLASAVLEGTGFTGSEPEPTRSVLELEMKTLKSWVSANPLDDYSEKDFTSSGCSPVESAAAGFGTFGGAVSEITELKTRAKGEKFCVFKLADHTGSLSVMLPPSDYERYKDAIRVGEIIKVQGKVSEKLIENGDSVETELQLVIKRCWTGAVKPTAKAADKILYIKTLDEGFGYIDAYEKAEAHRAKQGEAGYRFVLTDGVTVHPGTFRVSGDICADTGLECRLA